MWFAHIRRVFVALHLVAITLMALPAPEGGMDRAAWRDPTVQDELSAWTDRLNQCHIAVTRPELEDLLWRAGVDYMNARDKVLRPFGLYYELCGTAQSWRMFVAPHRYPARLEIDIDQGGGWRPVYIERDRQHDWLGRQLDSYRFRSVIFRFEWPGYENDYQRFADWVAAKAGRDFPEAQAVRIRLFKYRTLSPDELRAGQQVEGEYIQAIALPLEKSQ
jgi:hypothetical protein